MSDLVLGFVLLKNLPRLGTYHDDFLIGLFVIVAATKSRTRAVSTSEWYSRRPPLFPASSRHVAGAPPL